MYWCHAEMNTSVTLKVSPGWFPGIKNTSLTDTLDQYIGEWYALKADHETVLAYEKIQNVLEGIVQVQLNKKWEFYYNFMMRRDFEAWYADDYGSNVFLRSDDFDINVPKHFYLSFENNFIKTKSGRFPQRFAASKNRGLVVSGAPWYDGIVTRLDFKKVHYTYYFASLNPYLTGAPGSPGASLPDTEWAVQSSSPLTTQKYRVYNEASKSLIVQRLDYFGNSFQLSAMESLVLGGKYPTLRDINPFMMWHNLYQDGYVNEIISLEAKYQLSPKTTFYTEAAFDDLIGGTENENTSSDVYSWLVAAVYNQPTDFGELSITLEWIHTHEKYGNYALPLLQWTSRQLYYSNFRKQGEPTFSDTYIIDYPIGYFRGAGNRDLWFDFSLENENLTLQSSIGVLNKKISIDENSDKSSNEFRIQSTIINQLSEMVQIHSGGFYRSISNDNSTQNESDWGLHAGISIQLWQKKSP